MSADPIGAAPSTAAFVRAQMAKGVSAETLRVKLRIRPEHMLDLLSGGEFVPPLPKPVLARRPQHLPTGGWGVARIAMPRPTVGVSKAEITRRSMENRALAHRLAEMVVPAVAKITRTDRAKIEGADKAAKITDVRAMVFSLMHESAPTCPLAAVGHALNRQSAAVDSALVRCRRLRDINAEYAGWYERAKERLAQP